MSHVQGLGAASRGGFDETIRMNAQDQILPQPNLEFPDHIDASTDASCCSCLSSVTAFFQSFWEGCCSLFRMIGEALGLTTSAPEQNPVLDQKILKLAAFINKWENPDEFNPYIEGEQMLVDFNQLDETIKVSIRAAYKNHYNDGFFKHQVNWKTDELAKQAGEEAGASSRMKYQNAAIDYFIQNNPLSYVKGLTATLGDCLDAKTRPLTARKIELPAAIKEAKLRSEIRKIAEFMSKWSQHNYSIFWNKDTDGAALLADLHALPMETQLAIFGIQRDDELSLHPLDDQILTLLETRLIRMQQKLLHAAVEG